MNDFHPPVPRAPWIFIYEMIQLPNTEEAFVMQGVDSGSIFFLIVKH